MTTGNGPSRDPHRPVDNRLCESTLRVSNHSGKFDYYPRSGGRAVADDKFVVFTCTRRDKHDGLHGWCQGFDAYWTFQWGEVSS